jgi:lipopolysaccharide export system protein LptA
LRLLLALAMLAATPAATIALESDRNQPATVEADEVEYDFRTGVRTYKGNVIVTQGTLRITGDKLEVVYKGQDLESATAWGRPASFRQRPDGKDQDVIGKGKRIVLDQLANTLTLYDQASIQQGPDVANGDEIVYDITDDKLSVRGAATTQKRSSGEKAEASSAEPEKPTRARVVITPQTANPQ